MDGTPNCLDQHNIVRIGSVWIGGISYFLACGFRLYHNPATIGTLNVNQEATCQKPVPSNAASKPNNVNAPNSKGVFQMCKKAERIVRSGYRGYFFCYGFAFWGW